MYGAQGRNEGTKDEERGLAFEELSCLLFTLGVSLHLLSAFRAVTSGIEVGYEFVVVSN